MSKDVKIQCFSTIWQVSLPLRYRFCLKASMPHFNTIESNSSRRPYHLQRVQRYSIVVPPAMQSHFCPIPLTFIESIPFSHLRYNNIVNWWNQLCAHIGRVVSFHLTNALKSLIAKGCTRFHQISSLAPLADCTSKAAMDGLLHGLVCDLSQHNIQVPCFFTWWEFFFVLIRGAGRGEGKKHEGIGSRKRNRMISK